MKAAFDDARRNWFRLLDEVVGGEVVCIERGGRRILLQCDSKYVVAEPAPDYSAIVSAPDAAHADRWGWDWDESEGEVRPVRKPDEA